MSDTYKISVTMLSNHGPLPVGTTYFNDEAVKESLQRANDVYSFIHSASGFRASAIERSLMKPFIKLCKNEINYKNPQLPAFPNSIWPDDYLEAVRLLAVIIDMCHSYPNGIYEISKVKNLYEARQEWSIS